MESREVASWFEYNLSVTGGASSTSHSSIHGASSQRAKIVHTLPGSMVKLKERESTCIDHKLGTMVSVKTGSQQVTTFPMFFCWAP